MSDEEFDELHEFPEPARRSYRGVSRGPGASLEGAIHQAARAASEEGLWGRPFVIESIVIEPRESNQWVKGYSVTITEL